MTKARKGKKKPAPNKKAPKQGQKVPFIYNKTAQLILVFMTGLLLYANTLGHDYTQDDAIVIYDNEFTKQGIAGIPDILSKDTFHGFFGQKKNLVEGGRYRPLSLVLFAIEWQIFGESTVVGHLTNMLFYGLTCLVLYLFLLYLLNPKEKRDSILPWVTALGTTLLFAVHPLHTEAVANIKGLDEIFVLLFSLLAGWFVLRSLHEDNKKYWLLSGLMIFLGHMSKENAITFLGIIPVAMYLFTNADIGKIAKQMIPIFLGAALFWIIRYFVLHGGDAGLQVVGVPSPADLMNDPFVDMTMSERFATVTYTLGKYLQLLVAPITLTHDYYPYHIQKMNWGNWQVLLSLAVNLSLAAFAIWAFIKKERIGFGVMFYFMSMSIISNILFPIGTMMSERFMFMPSVGFALFVVWVLIRLGKKLNKGKEIKTLNDLKIPLALLAVVCLLFAGRTIVRNQTWKDNYTLFTTDVNTSTNSAKLQNAAGGEKISRALEIKNEAIKEMNAIKDPAQKKAREAQINQAFEPKVREAIVHLNKAGQIHPTYSNVYLQLGNAYNYLKEYPKSFENYKKSLDYKQNSKDALNNLGVTYRDAANYIGEKNNRQQYPTAMSYFRESIKYFDRLEPFTKEKEKLRINKAQTYRDWGKFYGERINNFDEALRYLNQAKDINPNDEEVYRYIGLCYASKGQTGDAIVLFEDLLKKQPDNANIMFNLGNFYRQAGQVDRGTALVQKALQIDPGLGTR